MPKWQGNYLHQAEPVILVAYGGHNRVTPYLPLPFKDMRIHGENQSVSSHNLACVYQELGKIAA
jgi:hypothetical protein